MFIREDKRRRGLWVMRADGTDQKRLTQSRESTFEASWSPNGKRTVFVRELPGNRGIFAINADGTGMHRLTRTGGEDTQPAWSPDSQRIAFIRSLGAYHIWSLPFTMRRDGTSVRRLASTGNDSSPGWLASGRVFYWDADHERWWSVDAEGSGKRRPLAAGTRVGDQVLQRRGDYFEFEALSPNGVWVAFESGVRIWVAHTDGTQRRLVTRKVCACWRLGIAWAPK